MRLIKALVLLLAVLDAAMFLQSPASPLHATTPTQVVGYATADNAPTDANMMIASAARR